MIDRTAEKTAFQNAKGRCLNSNHRRYPDYGGRGITFHEPWINDFESFYAEVGERPSPKHSLGRIDNELGYEPGNLEWQTKQEQAKAMREPRTKRLDFGLGFDGKSPLMQHEGKVQSMAAWAKEKGIKKATLYDRLIAGETAESALDPIHMGRRPKL